MKGESNNSTNNGLYTLLGAGQKVRLDADFRNTSIVEVVSQTKRRLYTTVKAPNGYEWDVMTNRLTIE